MIKLLQPFFQIFSSGSRIPVPRAALLFTLLKLAFLKRLKPSGDGVVIKFRDSIIHAPDYHSISVLLKEKFVEGQYYFDTGKQQPLIIDCGANIGISALYFKSLYANAVIHCFEPYSKAFSYLKLNIEQNKFENVIAHRRAVSKHDGEIRLNIPADRNLLNPTILATAGSYESEIVESTRLSTFLGSMGEVIDLIKLDVEGAEYEILTDLSDAGVLASRKVRMFVIEYHHSVFRDDMRLKDFVSMLTENNYEVTQERAQPAHSHSDILVRASVKGRKSGFVKDPPLRLG